MRAHPRAGIGKGVTPILCAQNDVLVMSRLPPGTWLRARTADQEWRIRIMARMALSCLHPRLAPRHAWRIAR
jgi:hypothetical protein